MESSDEDAPVAVPLAAAPAQPPAIPNDAVDVPDDVSAAVGPMHRLPPPPACTRRHSRPPSPRLPALQVPPPSRPPVPITLITGYLGAGKTTLVNYILTARHGYRCAVLLNEMADSADIERALVKEPEVCVGMCVWGHVWACVCVRGCACGDGGCCGWAGVV